MHKLFIYSKANQNFICSMFNIPRQKTTKKKSNKICVDFVKSSTTFDMWHSYFYLSVRLVRTRSCCSSFNFSLDFCCWFCVSTSLLLFLAPIEMHLLPLVMCVLARSICLPNCCRIDTLTVLTFDNVENICAAFLFRPLQ